MKSLWLNINLNYFLIIMNRNILFLIFQIFVKVAMQIENQEGFSRSGFEGVFFHRLDAI